MKAKVTSVQANGTWEGKFGLMYKYEVAMESGEVGEYSSSKYQDKDSPDFPFKIGEESEFEFQGGQYPKIKLPKKDFNNGFSGGYGNKDDVQLMIVRQSSLKCATEVLINNVDKVKADDIIKLAEHFTKWVMKVEPKPEPKAEVKPVQQQPVQQPVAKQPVVQEPSEPINDLPF